MCLAILAAGGCKHPSGPNWQASYVDARLKFEKGYTSQASQLADEGYRGSEKHEPIWSWRFRILKAQALLRQGPADQAAALLAADPPVDSPLDVSVRRKIVQGQAFCRLNKRDEAKALWAQAENLIPRAERGLDAELAFTRGLCQIFADPGTAQRHFNQATELAHGTDPFIEASALTGIGYLLLKAEHYDAAIDKFNEVLQLTDSHLLRERALGNAAECYAELGDWKKAIDLGEQAASAAAEINNDREREVWLIDLGRAHSTLFEFSKAEPYFSEALASAKRLKDTNAIWRCLNNLTQLALKRHDMNAAENYWKDESALNLGDEGKTYVYFDAASIAMERKEFTKAEQLFKNILQSKTKISIRLDTQRELGDVYWQEGRVVEAGKAFREAIKDAEAEIQRIPPEHQMSCLDAQPFYDSYVRFLVAQNKPIEALKIAERGRAQILSRALRSARGGQPALDFKKLQSLLKERHEIALAYSLTNEESFLWVIKPTSLKCVRLPGHTAIAAVFKRNDAEIRDPRPIEASLAGQDLYKTLVQAAANLIPPGSHVVVIPSKILSLINFEALIVPGDPPHYWIEDVQVETASSLTMLANSRAAGSIAAKSGKDLFLLGDPATADSSLPVLKHAAEEIDRVRSHFPAAGETIISGKDAVPQAYHAAGPGTYRFIHIDAHSIASDLSPLDSYVVLSPAANNVYKLFAHEITDTPLRADLVTISACYGAGTRWYNGEGIVGLGWAFLRAGAHQVVASLWAVDDASTPQLMDDFYGELSKGRSAAEALRAAKLKMLHSEGQRNRPYYWASLQLYTGS